MDPVFFSPNFTLYVRWGLGDPGMQQYEEHSRLASTASSTLSLVRGVDDGQLAVVKRVRCIPCKSKEEQMALAYAVQEARLLMHLRHPNIVRAKDFFTDGENHCIVLEYCAGGDLKQQIDKAAQKVAKEA